MTLGTGKEFFKNLENSMGIKISKTLINILIFQDLDQPAVLANYNPERVSKLEKYARSQAYKDQLQDPNDDEEKKIFWGTHSKNPENFKFTEGVIYQLEDMINALKPYKRKIRKIPTSKGRGQASRKLLQQSQYANKHDIATLISRLQECKKLKGKMENVEVTDDLQKGMFIHCPLCKKKYKTTKVDGHWQITNFTKHFEGHEKDEAKSNEAEKKKEQIRNNKNGKSCGTKSKKHSGTPRNLKRKKEALPKAQGSHAKLSSTKEPASLMPPTRESTPTFDVDDTTEEAPLGNSGTNVLENCQIQSLAKDFTSKNVEQQMNYDQDVNKQFQQEPIAMNFSNKNSDYNHEYGQQLHQQVLYAQSSFSGSRMYRPYETNVTPTYNYHTHPSQTNSPMEYSNYYPVSQVSFNANGQPISNALAMLQELR